MSEQSQKDLDKAKRDCEAEVKITNQSWASKCKVLEDKCTELQTEMSEDSEKLRQAEADINHSKLDKEQALQELESKLRHELASQAAITVKGLEDKIKTLENGKEGLNSKIVELMEEIKKQEQKLATNAIKFEKENNTLKQDVSNLQKDQAIKFAEYENLEKELAIANSIIEVTFIN